MGKRWWNGIAGTGRPVAWMGVLQSASNADGKGPVPVPGWGFFMRPPFLDCPRAGLRTTRSGPFLKAGYGGQCGKMGDSGCDTAIAPDVQGTQERGQFLGRLGRRFGCCRIVEPIAGPFGFVAIGLSTKIRQEFLERISISWLMLASALTYLSEFKNIDW